MACSSRRLMYTHQPVIHVIGNAKTLLIQRSKSCVHAPCKHGYYHYHSEDDCPVIIFRMPEHFICIINQRHEEQSGAASLMQL